MTPVWYPHKLRPGSGTKGLRTGREGKESVDFDDSRGTTAAS